MSKHHTKQERELAVREVMKLLKKKNMSFLDISKSLETAYVEEVMVPLTIYSEHLTPLESTVKFLRENREMKFSEIGKVTGRDQKAIAITYRAAARKLPAAFLYNKEAQVVPATIFNSKHLSAFEALVLHLRKAHSFMEISQMLGKDYRTVWTIYSRAIAKGAKHVK